MTPDEPQEVVVDGPDPRDWPHRENIWGHVEDIRAIADVQAALKGSSHQEASMLLSALKEQARALLAAAVLAAYPPEQPGQ
jgi:hypothetical protein